MRLRLLALALLCPLVLVGPVVVADDTPTTGTRPFTFHREGVLGTSFRLTVLCGSEEDASACEKTALDAIAALEPVLSTWSPDSEISRINAQPWAERKEVQLSATLGTVLRQGLRWRTATRGAFDCYIGDVIDLWRAAVKEGKEPDAAALAPLVEAAAASPGFSLARKKVGKDSFDLLTCDRAGTFNIDGLAKGIIIDQALQAVTRARGVKGALLAIGGDMRVAGDGGPAARTPWAIDVTDPREPADNAPPLGQIQVREKGISSSGCYARPMEIGGKKYMHILDPRTARPVEGVLGTTVVAADDLSANAIAVALCVLSPTEGLAAAKAAGAECVIVDSKGKVHASPGWARLSAAAAPAPSAWPNNYRVDIAFNLVDSTAGGAAPGGGGRGGRGGYKRPFVAAWIEDGAGHRVRLLALWANTRELKYLRKLPTFWSRGWTGSGGADDPEALSAQTRATRPAGAYTLTWDGRDDEGRPVPRGTYRIQIEVNREHGPGGERATLASLELACADKAARATAADQPELAGVAAAYRAGK